MRVRSLSLLLLLALAGACRRAPQGPIEASLIPRVAPLHDRGTPGPLRAATDAGLVRLDRDGQVVPAAALRWAILDNGLDYIFRIDDAGANASLLARRLRAALRTAPAPLRAVLAPIDSVQAVTGTVLELRLTSPQPDLLILLARPEFGLGAGGPLRIARRTGDAMLLRAASPEEPRPAPVLVRIEPAGRAVARFAAGQSRYVGGGTFADLPVARAAALPRDTLAIDVATGLFGLVPRSADGPAADGALRQALALAIDRDRIVAAIGAKGLAKATTIAGSTFEPPLAERLAAARGMIAGHLSDRPLRIAMPPGPGAHLLFALLAQDWSRLGVAAEAVGPDAPADFALLDMVAPPASLPALACAASTGCDPRDRLAVLAAPYIPIAAPLRWWLADRKLDGFTPNPLASHPLDQLRKVE